MADERLRRLERRAGAGDLGAAASTLVVEAMICVMAAGSLRMTGLDILRPRFIVVLGLCGGLPTLAFVGLLVPAGAIAATAAATLTCGACLVGGGLLSRDDLTRLRRQVQLSVRAT